MILGIWGGYIEKTLYSTGFFNAFEMEESCIERQEEELQALQAIYMDDFQDLREEVIYILNN